MTVQLAVLASGRGSNFASIADACERGDLDARVELLLSNNESAPVLDRAERRGIRGRYLSYDDDDRRLFEEEAVSLIRDANCDLVLLAGFMKVLSPYFVSEFEGRVLNIHPSLLPAFKGLNAQKQALDYGVKVSGCTVHVVTEEVDSGPIVDQRAVRVRDDDTVDSLSSRILEREHELYPKAIKDYINASYSPEVTVE